MIVVAVPATLIAAFALASASSAALAQAYPGKPLRLIVSSGPQGGTDTIARIAAATLSESLGQQVVVENRPGVEALSRPWTMSIQIDCDQQIRDTPRSATEFSSHE